LAGGKDTAAPGQGRRHFTPKTLARFNGNEAGLPILVAFRGRAYDVSDSFMWMHGRHFWHLAGRDPTAQIERSPHGEEVFERVRCVGVLDLTSRG
jgi:predicted heme/steroid binding protein